ncbi:hypothetical protein BC936DRAFT_148607 [Jimgerdemannia flammicorona]|uniref:Uncharacterized protein n=1 Tax=Jimgerdemannia flammicorona TaxID=994334 RepID=A0A433D2P5_9FUNG|nr:hypothetical protein BC936DRAFT_148607 [Jimgerdemannia flammicorona]
MLKGGCSYNLQRSLEMLGLLEDIVLTLRTQAIQGNLDLALFCHCDRINNSQMTKPFLSLCTAILDCCTDSFTNSKLPDIVNLLSSGASDNFFKLLASTPKLVDVLSDHKPIDVKLMNRQMTIIRFYMAHLNTIIVEYGDLVAEGLLKTETGSLYENNFCRLKGLVFIMGRYIPPSFTTIGLSPQSNLQIQKSILPSFDDLVRALFFNIRTKDNLKYLLIKSFFDDSFQDRPHHTFIHGSRKAVSSEIDLEKGETAVIKVKIMGLIVRQFNCFSHSLQTRLLCRIPADDLAASTCNTTFCFLRTFLSQLNDCPPVLFCLPHLCPDQEISQEECDEFNTKQRTSSLCVQSMTSLVLFAHLIPPELFVVWERCTLDILMEARYAVVPILVVHCWGVVGKSLAEKARRRQLEMVMRLETMICSLACNEGGENVDTQSINRCMDVWQHLGEILVNKDGTINLEVFYATHIPIGCISTIAVGRSNNIREKFPSIVELSIDCLRDSARLIKILDAGDDAITRQRKLRQIAITVNVLMRLLAEFPPSSAQQLVQVLQILDAWLLLPEAQFLISHVAVCNLVRTCAFTGPSTEWQAIIRKLFVDIFSHLLHDAQWLSSNELFQFIIDYAASGNHTEIVNEIVPETLHSALMDFIDQRPHRLINEHSELSTDIRELSSVLSINDTYVGEGGDTRSSKSNTRTLSSIANNALPLVSAEECAAGARVVQDFLQALHSSKSLDGNNGVDCSLRMELDNLRHTLGAWLCDT